MIFTHSLINHRIPLESTVRYSLPIYKSPEVLVHGDDGYGFSSDVYSFAVFLYQMFSCTLLFPDRMFVKLFEQRVVSGGRMKRTDGINEDYWRLIQACWSSNPCERPSFDDITSILRDDRFSIEEFGMKTDIDELHEYQMRTDTR